MCLIFLSVSNHPDYKLIVAANRDEFYQRETTPVHFWEDHPHILGGRDMEASGTWMAMSKNGKISMVTNYRDPQNINPKAPSRGQLVSDYLENGDAPEAYLKDISSNGKSYNGFNLVVGSPNELFYYSNYKGTVEKIEPGIHGLSNHLLNTPWPKVERGLEKMKHAMADSIIDPIKLFDVLYDSEIASDEKLPDTGVGVERERMLSSMFIKSPNYGTRCSTVVMVNQKNEVVYSERVYDLETFKYTTRTFEFLITPSLQ
jgi:uncharacterized protein with NRDE domain